MSIRKDLADAIRTSPLLPTGWKVFDYAQPLGNPQKPVIVVRQTSVRRTPQAPRLYRDADFTIALLVPEIDPERAEDALDAGVETLIDVVESLDFDGLVWTNAERVTFDEKFHGYDLTATVTNEKE